MRRGDGKEQESRFWRWFPLLSAIAGGFAFLLFGTAVIDHYTSPRIGKPCREHRDCGLDEFCLRHLTEDARYCTTACASDTDCPMAMRCGDVASTTDRAERGIGAVGEGAGAPACLE